MPNPNSIPIHEIKVVPRLISRRERKWECPECGRWNKTDEFPSCIFCLTNINEIYDS